MQIDKELFLKVLMRTKIDGEGCWLWQGGLTAAGYGNIEWKAKQYKPHRIMAHVFLNLNLNSDLLVCHHCDVRSCLNPTHLFIGTAKDNTQDALRKLRMHHGDTHYRARVTGVQVKEIRAKKLAGVTIAELARQYKLGETTVGHIVARRSWKHV